MYKELKSNRSLGTLYWHHRENSSTYANIDYYSICCWI